MSLKPIETVYKGYRFRSRLEARWAVFFDAIGAQYEYENQGYQLAHGWYLPDFYLPVLDGFVEVKPLPMPAIGASTRERDLLKDLCVAAQKPGLLVYGDPANVMEHWESISFGDCDEDPSMEPRDGFWGMLDRLHDSPIWGFSHYKMQAEAARQARFEHGQV